MLEWPNLLRELITLFVVIDPIGSLPVFLYATANVPKKLHRSFALRAVLVAGAVLLAFLIGGQFLLESLGLRLGSFQVAGGIVLFLFALSMIFGEPKPSQEIEAAERDHLAGAVFPLAMPSIASPGAMLAIVILTDNHSNPVSDQIVTAALLVLILAVTLVLLLMAGKMGRLMGTTGASVISRVMGIILATVAVDATLGGLDALGILNLSPVQQPTLGSG
ncbi:MarC family protein [Sulfitobacter sp. AS59]|jgi:multiple antibiotic resistance protein|uniref:MarC family protein n=1 Tax=Sulfitobacter sp. AS59 TaxID=3135784 RepID=UPI0030FC08E5